MTEREYRQIVVHTLPHVTAQMMFKLARRVHDEKPAASTLSQLIIKLREEYEELLEAIHNDEPSSRVLDECADLANVAMMLYIWRMEHRDDYRTHLARDSGINPDA